MKNIGKFKYILFLLKPCWKYGKGYLIGSLVVSVLLAPASRVLTTLLPKNAIDGVLSQMPAPRMIGMVALFTLGIAVCGVVSSVMSRIYMSMVTTKLQFNIHREVNEKALHTDFKYYDDPEFFSTYTYTQEMYANNAINVANVIPYILQGAITAIAMGAIIAASGPVLLLVALVFVVISTLLTFPEARLSADFSVKMNDLSRPVNYVYRVIQQKENAMEMRTSSAGEKLLRSFGVVLNKYFAEYFRFIMKTMRFSLPRSFLSPIQSAVVILYVIIFIIDGDTTKIGLYASVTAAAAALTSSIDTFFNQINSLYQAMLQGERCARFFETESIIEVPAPENAAAPPEGSYSVEFRDVSFGYNNATFAIEGLNLKIPAGGRIAIVGENGAGKSTLTKLLLRLYDVGEGSLLINGKDIREYDVHKLRRHIGIAYQDVRVLAMSLRDNLTAYHDATDEELMEIMEKLGLEEVMKKVGGDFSTMVSREFTDNGAVLSGGEAQRLAIARMFTGPFGLLLLDEPSSALDPLAESKLMKLILDVSNTATTIMIAHRLSTVRDFDIIYNVHNGKIIECGTHDELMAAHGKYFEMFTTQSENYQNAELA